MVHWYKQNACSIHIPQCEGEEDFECLIKRGEEEDEDNGSDDKKLRRGAASQGFLYFCLQLILCAKLSPEL